MSKVNKTNIWVNLKKHQKEIASIHLRDFFKDPNRFKDFSLEADDFFLDYSKNLISEETMKLLYMLANKLKLKSQINAMFNGEKINWTENRSVLHTALRDKSKKSIIINNKNIKIDIQKVLDKVDTFSNGIRNGSLKGYTGKKFKSVVHIGIGGSDLGPRVINDSLKYYHDGPKVYFVSNVDASELKESLKNLSPETTLFLIASKTFTTQETMRNAKTAKNWILKSLSEKAIGKHFAAISTNEEKVVEFGIKKSNIFIFWDFVGGRYSSWSSIGLPIAIAIGYKKFNEFLEGGYEMDIHFQNKDYHENLPVILGLIGLWYNNFFNAQTYAIVPYDFYLSNFSDHIQQLDMESNGKYIDRDNQKVEYDTGPIVWGKPGTNGQHAFFQLLHQGTKLIPCDFIGFKKSLNQIEDHHDILMANLFAQTKALAFGLTKEEVKKKILHENKNEVDLIPHRTFPGNRPTNTILIDKLTPKSIGKLLALYEHKIFVQGAIWGVNSFDQWGVELGKNLANEILKQINTKSTLGGDVSTDGLLKKYLT